MSYQFIHNALIIVALLHFISYFCIQVTLYIILQKTGSGLHLVPHKLNNNEIQFEGYDKDMKHLFTFRLADQYGEDGSPYVRRSGDSHANESEFSNDETSHYGFGESLCEGDRMTEYDAAEQLLNLQP